MQLRRHLPDSPDDQVGEPEAVDWLLILIHVCFGVDCKGLAGDLVTPRS